MFMLLSYVTTVQIHIAGCIVALEPLINDGLSSYFVWDFNLLYAQPSSK